MTYALWIVQALLALLFLFSGAMKFIMPIEEMTRDIQMPVAFLRFIGVAEILGGVGLVLPSLLRIRPGLTPLAAAGLGITMIRAAAGGLWLFVVGLLTVFVAYGRWKLAPIAGSSRGAAFREARGAGALHIAFPVAALSA